MEHGRVFRTFGKVNRVQSGTRWKHARHITQKLAVTGLEFSSFAFQFEFVRVGPSSVRHVVKTFIDHSPFATCCNAILSELHDVPTL